MKLRPKKISAIAEHDYEAVFEGSDGEELVVRFHVTYGRNVALVQPTPDIFMEGRANSREITPIVLALHCARCVDHSCDESTT